MFFVHMYTLSLPGTALTHHPMSVPADILDIANWAPVSHRPTTPHRSSPPWPEGLLEDEGEPFAPPRSSAHFTKNARSLIRRPVIHAWPPAPLPPDCATRSLGATPFFPRSSRGDALKRKDRKRSLLKSQRGRYAPSVVAQGLLSINGRDTRTHVAGEAGPPVKEEREASEAVCEQGREAVAVGRGYERDSY